jgi:quercetin dioxygenase-like cupin family protein
MPDTTVKKIDSKHSPVGEMGQKYLVTGVRMAMRLWERVPAGEAKEPRSRPYETLGYVLEGRAELEVEGSTVLLEPGDSWVVPKEARHSYRVLETFSAVEATSPPAHVHGRDEPAELA